MAGGNHEQVATQKLLGHNFSEQRWRTAALKNAYALMGKHRFGNTRQDFENVYAYVD
jgi:RAVE protein 1 C terminal